MRPTAHNGYAALTGAIWLVALAAVAWIVAARVWDSAAPAPVTLPASQPSDALQAAQSIAAMHLMGESVKAPEAAAPVAQYKLLGAQTASGRLRGFAILAEQGQAPVPVVEGEEISPGVTLAKVLPGRVQINRNGQIETIEISEAASAPPSPAQRASGPAAGPVPGAPVTLGSAAPQSVPGVTIEEPRQPGGRRILRADLRGQGK